MIHKSEMFLYLDDLKAAGTENMFGARNQLMRVFDCPPKRASEILLEWMKIHGQRNPKEVKP